MLGTLHIFPDATVMLSKLVICGRLGKKSMQWAPEQIFYGCHVEKARAAWMPCMLTPTASRSSSMVAKDQSLHHLAPDMAIRPHCGVDKI